jgi:hypothetical protein
MPNTTTPYEIPGHNVTIEAAGDLSGAQFRAVTRNSAGRAALHSGQGTRMTGILQNKPSALGRAGPVMLNGTSKAVASAAIVVDAPVTTTGDGRFMTAVTGDLVVGRAVTAASAADAIFTIEFGRGELVP